MMNSVSRPYRVWRWGVTPALLFIVSVSVCLAQSPLDDKPAEALTNRADNLANGGATDSEAINTETGMPAEQLIQVLRGNPQVMVEVKSVIADQAQQRGLSIQPDALTDQQVYSQLEASTNLRASVTEFLRSRGYISEADIETARRKYSRDRLNNASEDRSGSSRHDQSAFGLAGDEDQPQGFDRDEHSTRAAEARVWASNPPIASERRNDDTGPNITDEPSVLRRPAPYNLRSMRDLYTQVPDSPDHLKRFGSDLFTVRETRLSERREAMEGSSFPALDVPLGPDYVLGPGDEINIALWGGVSQTIVRSVDREGRVSLPEAGPVEVAGLTLQQGQSLISTTMQTQYRNARVLVTVAQVRSIRIFVVGDVQRPGAYEVNALVSPISALFAAGGPTAVGSLRILRHFRNHQMIGEIDLYDFMLHGVHTTEDKLQGGDTLLVPPVGKQVAVFGAVKRPAIYELRDERDLAAVLDDAGGLTAEASLAHITIERVIANQSREEVAVDAGTDKDPSVSSLHLRETTVEDGDRIHVATVLPYIDQVVYLQGHVSRPGKFPFREGMQLNDVLRTFEDMLPEPADRGEIVRLCPPDLHPETIEFSVPDVLIGNTNVPLQPFDTIRIFSRYEVDAPKVSVRGEVERPGTYAMFKGMTVGDLVLAAGGFKRDALLRRADLASYQVENGSRVDVERHDIAIGDAVLKGDRSADIMLKAGDVLTIHQLTGWNDIGASIIIEGEVDHPGSYGFQPGEHLSDVLRRAGGFRSTAYPEGAVLTRLEVATLEAKSREELIRQIETSAASARMSPSAGGEQGATLQLIQQQQEQVLSRLRSQPATGRLVIHIDLDIDHWAGTAADIEVRSGDTLRIPKRPGFVLVTGQVYSPSAITFIPGHTAAWYLSRVGGPTSIANRKEIFIVRANGSVIGHGEHGWFDHTVLSTRLQPGDTIVVPQKIIGPSLTWRNLLASAQIIASLTIAGAVAGL